ncbi:DUF1572 domain-containing protein [Flavobacterium sp. RSSA_27]|uniref:DUF1572 domain-containing protein n=1 Tax=Flavobacterium sp. RSSA_27 TaxID=3447667 RepID=UPI003F3D18B8
MEQNAIYLESVKKQFLYYKLLGEKAINQLTEEQLFLALNDDTNSIALIVKHLSGNMLSRWTDFLTTDGEKDFRNRDAEFENNWNTKDEVMAHWDKGWNCFLNSLESLQPEQLNTIIYIRNEGHTVMEAINRQLAHYPYHIGQIVFSAKQLKNGDWESLSIPKNKSQSYNSAKFAQEKKRQHFTDEETNRLKNQ